MAVPGKFHATWTAELERTVDFRFEVPSQHGPGGQSPGPSLSASKLSRSMQYEMDKPSLASWALGAGFGAVSLWAVSSAIAAEIRIDGGDCASAVHLVARDAPLSDVLKGLAKALDFQLSFEADSDPLVSVDAIRQPIDLVSRLAPLENVSMIKARNPRCSQHERIVKVWVLPKGQGSVVRTATTPPNARQIPEDDEPARRAQAGFDMILNAHGVPTAPGGQAEPR
jgi:hypothetical protein